MTFAAALRAAWHTYRTRFPEMLLTLLVQAVIRLMALTPLLFLTAPETRLLALLSLPLYILLVLPARQNTADAMRDALDGGHLFTLRLISPEHYGRKVARGIRQALLLMLWGALFLAATGLAVFVFAGKTIEGVTDVFTLVRALMKLGGGSSIQGAIRLMLIYAATLLPLLAGIAFHSGTRHAIARGGRRLVEGHRGGVMLTWLIGCIALLPAMAVMGSMAMNAASAVASALANLGRGSMSLSLGSHVPLMAAIAVVLLIPAIPFKQLLSAAYVRELALKAGASSAA